MILVTLSIVVTITVLNVHVSTTDTISIVVALLFESVCKSST